MGEPRRLWEPGGRKLTVREVGEDLKDQRKEGVDTERRVDFREPTAPEDDFESHL